MNKFEPLEKIRRDAALNHWSESELELVTKGLLDMASQAAHACRVSNSGVSAVHARSDLLRVLTMNNSAAVERFSVKTRFDRINERHEPIGVEWLVVHVNSLPGAALVYADKLCPPPSASDVLAKWRSVTKQALSSDPVGRWVETFREKADLVGFMCDMQAVERTDRDFSTAFGMTARLVESFVELPLLSQAERVQFHRALGKDALVISAGARALADSWSVSKSNDHRADADLSPM